MQQLMERMNVKFETLPPEVQGWFYQMWGAPQPQSPTTTQQEVAIKNKEADAKVLQAHSKTLADHSAEPPQITPPQSIGGRIFHDDTTQKAATELMGLRGGNNNAS